MKKSLFIISILVFMTGNTSYSQNFKREAGIRGGHTSGFTLRQYLHESLSYEGILSFGKSGIQFTLLRQVHEMNPLFELPSNVHFIYGYGGHTGYYFSDSYNPFGFTEFKYPYRMLSPLMGIDAYVGIEYRFESIPAVFGLDYKPFFEFSLYQFYRMSLWDMSLTAKYKF